ncbi:hypothetical protein [Burkholderia multivorans]|uniref:hypothetical protein n=1 Tax=Burkholderia multivorans TaxID=87883 RepID=UPI0019060676|nr:hypothetical protein [Burkholderia multivorans]MBJ9624850.1 hypothetical protein [Burkholderia multivorans]
MTDHTTPMPEPPADPNRDPEDDPLSPPSPGHHHDNPQQPDGPPSKDPVWSLAGRHGCADMCDAPMRQRRAITRAAT